jgi:hypothetical protein
MARHGLTPVVSKLDKNSSYEPANTTIIANLNTIGTSSRYATFKQPSAGRTKQYLSARTIFQKISGRDPAA